MPETFYDVSATGGQTFHAHTMTWENGFTFSDGQRTRKGTCDCGRIVKQLQYRASMRKR